MRWAVAALVLYSLVYTGVSADSGDERRLKIMARTSVYNVGEQKGIYCEGTNIGPDDMEWENPEGGIVEVRSSKNSRVYVERRPPKLLVLIIHSLKLKDNGNWTCKSKDDALSETIPVTVGEKAIVDGDEEIQEDEGSNIKLTCRVKGNPPPTIQWYKEDTGFIDPIRNKYVIKNKSDEYTLEIKKLDHTDAGKYLCKVTQKILRHYLNKSITLTVSHKPIPFDLESRKYIAKVVEVFAAFNESKKITCSALAYPPPTFTWYKKDKNFFKSVRDTDQISTSDDRMTSTLNLLVESDDDMGQYKCEVKNPKGSAFVIYDLLAGTKPLSPSEIKFVGANATYITFQVTCENCTFKTETEDERLDPEHLPLVGYSFQLLQEETPYVPDWNNASEFEVDIEDPQINTFEVGPLQNNTVFHVRVRSVNAAGYSEWLEMSETAATTDHAIRFVASSLLLVVAYIVIMCY